jgi:hypothetical protein
MNKICSFEVKGAIVWFKQKQPNWVLKLKFFVTYLYKIKCIYNIVCIVTYNQSVKVVHFEGWRKKQLHHNYKGDWKSFKVQVYLHT